MSGVLIFKIGGSGGIGGFENPPFIFKKNRGEGGIGGFWEVFHLKI